MGTFLIKAASCTVLGEQLVCLRAYKSSLLWLAVHSRTSLPVESNQASHIPSQSIDNILSGVVILCRRRWQSMGSHL